MPNAVCHLYSNTMVKYNTLINNSKLTVSQFEEITTRVLTIERTDEVGWYKSSSTVSKFTFIETILEKWLQSFICGHNATQYQIQLGIMNRQYSTTSATYLILIQEITIHQSRVKWTHRNEPLVFQSRPHQVLFSAVGWFIATVC